MQAKSVTAASRWYIGILSALLMTILPAGPKMAYGADAEPPVLGGAGCPWPELSGRRLLDRSLGSVSFSNAAVWEITEALVHKYGVPLSFIEASPEKRLTVILPGCTLKQLLGTIVAADANYRYGFVGSHLVLYPSDPKWQTRIDGFGSLSGTREEVSFHLGARLRRLAPSLGHFGIPTYPIRGFVHGIEGSFLFMDHVEVAGPGTVVELLTQVLGKRTSAVFAVTTRGAAPPQVLWVDAAEMVKSIEVTSPVTTLRHLGEKVQLKITGVLPDGTRQDLTVASCGTQYQALDQAMRVNPDGLLTAVAPGYASVLAIYDNLTSSIRLGVVPEPSR